MKKGDDGGTCTGTTRQLAVPGNTGTPIQHNHHGKRTTKKQGLLFILMHYTLILRTYGWKHSVRLLFLIFNMSHNRNFTASRSIAVGTSAVVVTAISASSCYWMYQFVSKYGWVGAFRYAWQGDPYSPNVRASVDVLDDVERVLPNVECRIEQLEESLARTKLNVIDGGGDNKSSPDYLLLRPVWSQLHAPRDLQCDLAKIDSTLDKLAGKVDTVYTYTELHLKTSKKALSQVLVRLMERLDVLLASYGIDDTVPRVS